LNSQEREELIGFLQQLKNAQPGVKDAEAEALIQETCRQQADAHYLLVQRAILLGQALAKANAEITHLQQSLASSKSSGGFLDSNAWGNAPTTATRNPQSAAAAPVAPAASASSWGTGLLGTVASTAAGVVAGSFLFQGIEHLMGSHNSNNLLGAHESTPPVDHLASNDYADAKMLSNDLSDLGPAETADPDWL
jgi:hypothetical protein